MVLDDNRAGATALGLQSWLRSERRIGGGDRAVAPAWSGCVPIPRTSFTPLRCAIVTTICPPRYLPASNRVSPAPVSARVRTPQ